MSRLGLKVAFLLGFLLKKILLKYYMCSFKSSTVCTF